MPTSVRLDQETEDLLVKTAKALKATKSDIVKASVRDYCNRTLKDRSERPYDLIEDLIGKESSGRGNLAIDSEKILRRAFRKE